MYMYIGKFPGKKKTEEDFICMFMFCDCDKIGSEVSIYRVTLFAENLILDFMSFFLEEEEEEEKGRDWTDFLLQAGKEERKSIVVLITVIQ